MTASRRWAGIDFGGFAQVEDLAVAGHDDAAQGGVAQQRGGGNGLQRGAVEVLARPALLGVLESDEHADVGQVSWGDGPGVVVEELLADVDQGVGPPLGGCAAGFAVLVFGLGHFERGAHVLAAVDVQGHGAHEAVGCL